MMKLKDALDLLTKHKTPEAKWFEDLAINANMPSEYLAACILLKAVKEFSDQDRVYKIYKVKLPTGEIPKKLAVLKLCRRDETFPDEIEPEMGDPIVSAPESFYK
jgi:hypothetical protein